MAAKTPPDVITQDWFTQTFGRPTTPGELEALAPRLQEYGFDVHRNAEGVAGKVAIPMGDGSTYYLDVIQAAGSGGSGFLWPGDVNLKSSGASVTAPPPPATGYQTNASSFYPTPYYASRIGVPKNPPPTKPTGPSAPPTPSPAVYGAAYMAQARQRSKSQAGGRQSTILGGFGAGRPSTKTPTLLGA